MYPEYEEIMRLAPDYHIIPICKEIYADVIRPITLLRKIAAVSKRYYLLESVDVVAPLSSAAAVVIILNVDPGS